MTKADRAGDPAQRWRELVETIEDARSRYYVRDAPTLSDAAKSADNVKVAAAAAGAQGGTVSGGAAGTSDSPKTQKPTLAGI